MDFRNGDLWRTYIFELTASQSKGEVEAAEEALNDLLQNDLFLEMW